MRFELLTLLAALAPSVLAIPVMTISSTSATALTVKWTDDGTAPTLSQLKSYTLTLFVGGASPGTNADGLVAIGTGNFPATSATGTVTPTTLAYPYTNGFYVQMVANAKEGGTVTLYSQRFTVSGLTGTSDPQTQKAITAAGGAVPADANAVAASAPAAAPGAGNSAAVPVGADIYNTPYNKQAGLTKYAPMQGIPPTKISLKNFTPLYPTSAYTVATTWLPKPSIVTTLTESQTWQVKSSVNQAKTQSQPTPNNDMQKFLARWKD